MGFTFSKVRLIYKRKKNTDTAAPTKYLKQWYVTYVINYPKDEFPDYPVQRGKPQPSLKNKKYPKIFGKEYDSRLNEIKDVSEKLMQGKILKDLIEEDLMLGVDPRLKEQNEDNIVEQADAESTGVTYDEALIITKKYMQWGEGIQAKQITETQNMSFFNNDFRRYVHHIGKSNDVTKITIDDLKKYVMLHNNPEGAVICYNGKDYPVGRWSINTGFEKIRIVAQVFNALIDKDLMEVNPTLGVTDIRKKLKKTARPKTTNNRYEIWSSDELERFHEIGNNDEWMKDYTVGLITYYTFWRASEILRFKVGMIDYDNNRFIIPSTITKGHQKYDKPTYLYVKIPQILMNALKKYVSLVFNGDQNDDYCLFPNPDKGFLVEHDYSVYKSEYKYFAKALDIDKNQYALKHSGVTEFYYKQLERGVPIPIIIEKLRKMCRHADPSETMKYLNLQLGLSIDDETEDEWG